MREKTYKVIVGRPDEYKRIKNILNKGRHPTFIGKDRIRRSALNGGLLFFQDNGIDCGVCCVNTRKNTLTVLNVNPDYRRKGLGKFIVDFVKPNFVRSLDSSTQFFEKCGYKKIGELKQGRKLKTQIMVRENLIGLCGRISRVLSQKKSELTVP